MTRRGPFRTHALELMPAQGVPLHSHERHQLAVVEGGCLTVIAQNQAFVVPGSWAIWIPAGIPHAIRNRARARLSGVYLARELGEGLPQSCCVLAASPLLRELVLAAQGRAERDGPPDALERLAGVIVDEIAEAPVGQGCLPLPSAPALRKIASALIDEPASALTLAQWGRRVGASGRTLLRRFREETGLSFAQWRTQLRLLTAIAWLAQGRRIADIANDLGYQSPSAFIAMFRREVGVSPRRYLNSPI